MNQICLFPSDSVQGTASHWFYMAKVSVSVAFFDPNRLHHTVHDHIVS